MYTYLIIGRSFSSLKEKIKERGDDYIVLKDAIADPPADKKYKRVRYADFENKDALISSLKQLDKKIDGVVVTYENYVLPAAWIAKELNLPGMPEEAAEACTDKYIMRGLFQKAAFPISPAYMEVSSFEQATKFSEEHGFPIILKPANLAKSLLVIKCNDSNELKEAYDKIAGSINKIYEKYAPHRTPKLLIEEFMVGNVYSVDAFIDGEGVPQVLENVVDYQTGHDIGYDDNFHYSRLLPSKLSDEDQLELRKVAAEGIKSLGMKNSPAHVEVIMTKSGPKIVEIGARNGGYRERMHAYANDIDILGAALDLSLGKIPDVSPKKNESCAVLELFPKIPGLFKGIENEDKLKELSSLKYLSVKAKPDNFVGKSSDGYKMCAVVILHNQDKSQFDKDLDFVRDNVWVKTEPISS